MSATDQGHGAPQAMLTGRRPCVKTPSRWNTRATGAQGHNWGSSYRPGSGDRLTHLMVRVGEGSRSSGHTTAAWRRTADPGGGRDSARREHGDQHGRPARAPQLPRPREGGDAEQDEP